LDEIKRKALAIEPEAIEHRIVWQQNLDSTPRIKGGVAQSDVLMAGWYSNTRQVTKQTSV
jgi:hypothetical protein